MENKITATEYINDVDSLEIFYTPYDMKIDIVNAILNEMVSYKNNIAYVDRAVLTKVADVVFIGAATNIDLMIVGEDGLDGYDVLCKEKKLEELIDIIDDEYNTFYFILDSRIDTIKETETGIGALINIIDQRITEFAESINHIDTQKASEFITKLIKDNITKFGKE